MDARLIYLFERYTAGNCTEAEQEEYLHMVKQDAYADDLQLLILAEVERMEEDRQMTADESDAILRSILKTPVKRLSWMRWAAAAAVLLVLGIGAWWWQIQQNDPKVPVVADIVAGGSKVTLTLGDGTLLELDSAGHQTLQQGGTAVTQSGGQLQYNVQNNQTAVSYNKLTIPRGGQFRITLPDGTIAWLNAASSLRYPTAFTGKEREVEVTGEAYFEVAKDAVRPFLVKAGPQVIVQVLGTGFNINAYADEAGISTTLLEGSVKVWRSGESLLLAPGQQAQATKKGLQLIKNIQTDRITAWKNGLFNFEDARMEEVMRQLARWYDVEVVYAATVPDIQFWGEIRRSSSLQEVLRMLERTGVHFRLEANRKVIVMP